MTVQCNGTDTNFVGIVYCMTVQCSYAAIGTFNILPCMEVHWFHCMATEFLSMLQCNSASSTVL